MSRKIFALALLLGIGIQTAAAEDTPGGRACELVKTTDLAEWGYGPGTRNVSWMQDLDKSEASAPVNVHSELCSMNSDDNASKGVAIVVFEAFSGDTSADNISAWLKAVAARDRKPGDKFEEVQVQEATCESGEYAVPSAEEAQTYYYVSCDRLMGRQRVAINVQQTDAAKLPTPPQVKKLLDQAIKRLGAS